MDVSQLFGFRAFFFFLIHLPVAGHFSCFKPLAITDEAAVMSGYKPTWTSFFLDKYLRLKWLDHTVGVYLTF